ncbi:hypothetical protein CEUSTIGMA_g3260.t1 [Chlamydomonas eustigma]|uniref:Uncharacterized protein n=1 Tax=Chlamydomonas eustigma TaxID=1157962 RepID=A0A250WY98_9CHLO|nr:hypothetical protein CEUSTIGMA_g3260.t1 [Chlamydomonas eustigma]|eukprot:GAX75817.1 hypothetical protein CEUSTIGMA_g3260.t1 [Chlamydomonas eustigma]
MHKHKFPLLVASLLTMIRKLSAVLLQLLRTGWKGLQLEALNDPEGVRQLPEQHVACNAFKFGLALAMHHALACLDATTALLLTIAPIMHEVFEGMLRISSVWQPAAAWCKLLEIFEEEARAEQKGLDRDRVQMESMESGHSASSHYKPPALHTTSAQAGSSWEVESPTLHLALLTCFGDQRTQQIMRLSADIAGSNTDVVGTTMSSSSSASISHHFETRSRAADSSSVGGACAEQ